MSGFKLLAIRPFLNCNNRFSKNLQKGLIYKFYKNYDFLDKDGLLIELGNHVKNDVNGIEIDNDVYEIIKKQETPEDLYKITTADKHDINVQISSIVGKNGSGKSTLIELLYALCYVIALKKGIIKDNSDLSKLINGEKIDHNKLFEKIHKIEGLYNDLRVEVYYEINGKFFSIWYNSDQVLYHRSLSKDYQNNSFNKEGIYNPNDLLERKYSFVLDQLFFYTISVNYSLYGLNSKFNNSWLNDLFHKNDGYQTPLVINPFRKEGNIDVNSEYHLAQSRLLSNLVDDNFSDKIIINNKKVEQVIFELDYDRYNTFGPYDFDMVYDKIKEKLGLNNSEFMTRVYNALYTNRHNRISNINLENIPNSEILVKYVYRKILKIHTNYEEYKLVDTRDIETIIPSFLQIFKGLINLKKDRSHITLKLRQILNTLRFNTLFNNDNFIWNEESDDYQKIPNKVKKHFFRIDIEEFKERIKNIKNKNSNLDIIEIIPAACFTPNLLIKNSDDLPSVTNFNALSSGEQHFIYSLQSILYHISNLNSVFHSENNKIKYNYINLVFDEIELYYHPEFQKAFIKELLEGIKSLKIEHVFGINILISTHSPFILSDIVNNSVLKLKNGHIDYSETKTFGANVHDILADDFFLEDGFMGDFAKNKIQETIDWLNKLQIAASKDRTLSNAETILTDKNFHKKIINLIDEPLLKYKLDELYFELFPDDIDKDDARNQIENLARKSGLDVNFGNE